MAKRQFSETDPSIFHLQATKRRRFATFGSVEKCDGFAAGPYQGAISQEYIISGMNVTNEEICHDCIVSVSLVNIIDGSLNQRSHDPILQSNPAENESENATNSCPICFDSLSQDKSLNCCTRKTAERILASAAHSSFFSSRSTEENPQYVVTAPCGHLFHVLCIAEAMRHDFARLQRPHCPLCRAPFAPAVAVRPWRWTRAASAASAQSWGVLVSKARERARVETRAAWKERLWRARWAIAFFVAYSALFIGLMLNYARH